MRERSRDALRGWAGQLPAVFEALSNPLYKYYFLNTSNRILKQRAAENVSYAALDVTHVAITVKQTHYEFMKRAKRSYAALDERIYSLHDKVVLLKDFVGVRSSTTFGNIKALLSANKNFIAFGDQMMVRTPQPVPAKETSKAVSPALNIKNLLELAPAVKGFILPRSPTALSPGFKLENVMAPKSVKNFVRRVRNYTGLGHSAALFYGLGDYEITSKRPRLRRRRKLTDVQEANRYVLDGTFKYSSYSRIHGLRNLHYEGADTI